MSFRLNSSPQLHTYLRWSSCFCQTLARFGRRYKVGMFTFWCRFNSGLRAKLLSHLLHWWLFSRLGLWVSMWGFRLFLRLISFPQISHLCPCFPAWRRTPITLQNVFKDTMNTWDVAKSELKVMGYRSDFGSSIDFLYAQSFKMRAFEVLAIERSANHVFYIQAGVEQYKTESLFFYSFLLLSYPCHRGYKPPFPLYFLPWGHEISDDSIWRSSRLISSLSKVVPSTLRTLSFDLSKSFGEPGSSDITCFTRDQGSASASAGRTRVEMPGDRRQVTSTSTPSNTKSCPARSWGRVGSRSVMLYR